MKALKLVTLAVALSLTANLAFAQERGFHGAPPPGRYEPGPPRGAYVGALPRDSVHMVWQGGHYWYRGGTWYQPARGRFVVIAPPIGVVVPVLPPYYSLRLYGGSTYYYADGAYYAAAPGGYVIVAPPPGAEIAPDAPTAAPAAPVAPEAPVAPVAGATRRGEPIVYPRNGQSQEQTWRDRGECAQWATGQSGTAGPDVYLRAFDACMDGRGYTVR